MNPTRKFVPTLNPPLSYVGAANRFIFFVLNSEEFVLRDEGEVFHVLAYFEMTVVYLGF